MRIVEPAMSLPDRPDPRLNPRYDRGIAARGETPAEIVARIRRTEAAEPVDHRRRHGGVELGEWADPEDRNALRRTKQQRRIKGHLQACAVRRLAKRQGRSGLISPAHVQAADRYRLAWDVGRLGYTPDPDAVQSRRTGPKSGPGALELAQAAAQRDFEAATVLIGAKWQNLAAFVILRNGDVRGWIDWYRALTGRSVRPDVAMGLLVYILGQLQEHYGIEDADPDAET